MQFVEPARVPPVTLELQPAFFGPYRLSSRLATGGMAEVYVGRQVSADGQFGSLVAVKRLLPHLAKDADVVRMFLAEARITRQISHPGVVTVLDLGEVDGEPFIAMELLEGHTFAELREKAAHEGKRVPLPVTLRVLTDACQGLDAAHRAVGDDGKPLALVHRDFTPENIHVGVRGAVKVIDFGIAKIMGGPGSQPGTLKGKFFYMSPEMIRGEPLDHRADVFAAGVMLYEQLCGHRPFTGHSVHEVLASIAEGKPKRPRDFDPSVPPALEAICLKALANAPSERFPSLAHMAQALAAGELASPEALGAYVSQLFPAEKDESRKTLRRAREADPSLTALPKVESSVESKGENARPARLMLGLVGALGLLGALVAGILMLKPATPAPSTSPLDEARAAIAAKQGKKAEAAIAQARLENPRDSAPEELLATLREEQGDARGAADAWKEAAKKGAGERALARAGHWLVLAGDLEEAGATLSRSLKKTFDVDAAADLGSVRLRQGNLDEALSWLRRATRKNPKHYEAQYLLAAALFAKGDTRGAREAYDAAEALAGDDERALVGRCQMETRLKGSDLDAVKARLAARFPARAQTLLARCNE